MGHKLTAQIPLAHHGRDAAYRQHGEDRVCDAAGVHDLLGYEQPSCLLDGTRHRLQVQGLDLVQLEDLRLDSLLLELHSSPSRSTGWVQTDFKKPSPPRG